MKGPHLYFEPTPGAPDWQGYCHPLDYEGKEAWSLLLYKYGACWATNFWAFQKLDEMLLNGSEECLDAHYQKLAKEPANWQSEMLATFSLAPLEGYEACSKLLYLEPWDKNPDASWYLDEALDMKWWLCPLWLSLWGNKEAPKECWLYLSLA